MKNMKNQILVEGFRVDVQDFGYASYFYPAFNHNKEFPVSKEGFRQLKHYLRTVKWAENIYQFYLG